MFYLPFRYYITTTKYDSHTTKYSTVRDDMQLELEVFYDKTVNVRIEGSSNPTSPRLHILDLATILPFVFLVIEMFINKIKIPFR